MRLKVFYLDDEEDLCENFSDYFASDKVAVTTFTDPDAAIEAVTKQVPDLFFVDYRLPGITGDEVAKLLPSDIPKFLLTGDISLNSTYKFIRVINKPYNSEEILKIIEEYAVKVRR